MSDWVFDLGNSRLKLARADAADPGLEAVAVAHDGVAFASGWDACLPAQLRFAGISSVASPLLTSTLVEALRERGARVEVVTAAREFAGVTIAYADPKRLGVDRLLAMAAAHAAGPAAALVVGVGTALTIDLVDPGGTHRGGRIAPSPSLMREALQRKVAHLPVDGGRYAEFAADTASALASGCDGAALALVERSHDQACGLVDGPVRIWLHGGGAAALQDRLPEASHAPGLVLAGLALWARRQGAARG